MDSLQPSAPDRRIAFWIVLITCILAAIFSARSGGGSCVPVLAPDGTVLFSCGGEPRLADEPAGH